MDSDMQSALEDFKSRYTTVTYPHDIMLEDWFFLLKMYFLLYNDGIDDPAAEVGFRRLFLDAIYNDGKIQRIYQNMSKEVHRFFNSFDELYTVNYDTNLEQLTAKQIYHLHGTFTELQASENPEYALGYLRKEAGESAVIPSFEHCFCNALLNYSGKLKYDSAKAMHRANMTIDKFPDPHLLNISNEEFRHILMLHKAHPELKIAPEYYFDRFEKINGELCIIGLSPNNDLHIINLIKNNPNITEVTFYCYSETEKKAVRKIGDHRFKPMDVRKLWTSLGINAPNKYTYKFPPNSDKMISLIKALGLLSDFPISWEEIKQEITSLPQHEIRRLCDEVMDELSAHDALYSSPKDFTTFKQNFAYGNQIALTEGISPPAMLVMLIMNWDNYTKNN